MAKEDILDLLVRRGVNPNRQPVRRVLNPATMGENFDIVGEGKTVTPRPNFTLGEGQALKYTDQAARASKNAVVPVSKNVVAPSQIRTASDDILDMLFRNTNKNIASQINKAGKLAPIGKAATGLGPLLGRGLSGLAAYNSGKELVKDLENKDVLGSVKNATRTGIEGAFAINPALFANPIGVGLGVGLAPGYGWEGIKNWMTGHKFSISPIDLKIEENLKAGRHPMDGLTLEDLVNESARNYKENASRSKWSQIPSTKLTDEDIQKLIDIYGEEENNNNGEITIPQQPNYLDDYLGNYGVVGETGDFINSLTGQNQDIQPEVPTSFPIETLPQNEQSISGLDLNGVNAQYDAANQDYLNKLIEFANNYRQNAVNDNRKNLALAMIAKGTHNPYLMQAGKLDNNKQMLDQLKIEEAIKEAQLKPIERAQAAIAYAKAGLPAELAYLSSSSMSPFASMYKTDMTRQNILDQIDARYKLQDFIIKNRALLEAMKEQGRNTRQEKDQQYKISPDYTLSRMIAGAGGALPDYLLEEALRKYGLGEGQQNSNTPTKNKTLQSSFKINKDLEPEE